VSDFGGELARPGATPWYSGLLLGSTLCTYGQYHSKTDSLTSVAPASNLLALVLLEEMFLLSKNIGIPKGNKSHF
jgi:hypothetical protein